MTTRLTRLPVLGDILLRNTTRALLTTTFLAATTLPTVARAQPMPMRFGGSVGARLVDNDLRHELATGVTGALTAEQRVRRNVSIIAELRAFQHEGRARTERAVAANTNLDQVDYSLGVVSASGNLAYSHRLPTTTRQGYATVGVGVYRMAARTSATAGLEHRSSTDRQNEVGMNVGGGVHLRRQYSLDVRYHRFSSQGAVIGMIPISLSMRF